MRRIRFLLPLAFASLIPLSTACTGDATDAAPDEPEGTVESAQVVCPFEVRNRIPPGDYNGTIEMNGQQCGSSLRITLGGTNGSWVYIEASTGWGARRGSMRLERTSRGYVARRVSGDWEVLRTVYRQIQAAKDANAVKPAAGSGTNWACVGAVLGMVGTVGATVIGCGTPAVGALACGFGIAASIGSVVAVGTSC